MSQSGGLREVKSQNMARAEEGKSPSKRRNVLMMKWQEEGVDGKESDTTR